MSQLKLEVNNFNFNPLMKKNIYLQFFDSNFRYLISYYDSKEMHF